MLVFVQRPWLRRVLDTKVIYMKNVYCCARQLVLNNFIQALSVCSAVAFFGSWTLNSNFYLVFEVQAKQAIKRGMGRASVWICSLVALILCLCIINIWMHAILAWNFGLHKYCSFSRKHSQTNKCNRQHSIC